MATPNAGAPGFVPRDALAADPAPTPNEPLPATAPEPNPDALPPVDPAEAPKDGDPPQVEYKFTVPEGVVADTELLTKFETIAREAGMPADKAQGLVDMHFEALKGFATAQAEAFTTTVEGWKTAVTSDPDFAGDKMAAAQKSIGRAFDTYGTPGVREAFDTTGAGWHPDIVKTIAAMAKALDEGAPSAVPKGPAGKKPSGASALYPDSN